MNNNESRFDVSSITEIQEKSKSPYKNFKREILNNGCFNIKVDSNNYKVYTPELSVIFFSNDITALNLDTQKETIISGWDYLKSYIEGYKKGEQFFESEYKISPDALYGENADLYVRDIHNNFFHSKINGISKGWSYVKKLKLNILTNEIVVECGYYSGIVNKIEEQVKKYSEIFKKFESCELCMPKESNYFENLDNSKKSKTEKFILEMFDNLDTNKGWEYAFIDKSEFDLYLNILVKFFKQEEYKLPENQIKLKKRSQTRTATLLGQLYSELAENQLSQDKKYLEIVRVLKPFYVKSDAKLYKDLTRHKK
jgi:hypothetical protein